MIDERVPACSLLELGERLVYGRPPSHESKGFIRSNQFFYENLWKTSRFLHLRHSMFALSERKRAALELLRRRT